MSVPCKIKLIKPNGTTQITYYSSDGYPNNIVPKFLDVSDLEPDEFPVFNESNDPCYSYEYLYTIDLRDNTITVETNDNTIMLRFNIDYLEDFYLRMKNLVNELSKICEWLHNCYIGFE